MRSRTTRWSTTAAAVLAATLAAAAPAVAGVDPGPPTEGPGPGPIIPGPVVPGPVEPGPVVPGPIVPQPPEGVIAWEVELLGAWRSPTWKQERGRTTAVVDLDCGTSVGIRAPRYHVLVMSVLGPPVLPVMPPSVPCGSAQKFTWDLAAGEHVLVLVKAGSDRTVLHGKAAVVVP